MEQGRTASRGSGFGARHRRGARRAWARLIACCGVLAILFGQFAASVHAYSMHSMQMQMPLRAMKVMHDTAAMPGMSGCAKHNHMRGAPAANCCEVHCSDAARAVPAVDVPPASYVALPGTLLSLAALSPDPARDPQVLLPATLAATLILQFGRILV